MKAKAYKRKYKGKTFELIAQGVEARVWKVRRRWWPFSSTVIRTERNSKLLDQKIRLQRRYLAHQIAHLLFPKHTIKIIGANIKKRRQYSRVKKMDSDLENWHGIYREWRHSVAKIKRLRASGKITKEEARKQITEVWEKSTGASQSISDRKKLPEVREMFYKFQEAGIGVDYADLNITLGSTKPAHYETAVIAYPEQLLRYLETAKISFLKKRKVLKLLATYQELPEI